jgi:hypothetical protein
MRSCLYGLSYIENASKRKNLISLALLRLRVCALDFEWEQKNIKKNFRDKLSSLVSIYHLPIPDLIQNTAAQYLVLHGIVSQSN